MNNHTLQSCENLIHRYVNKLGGEIITIKEGGLGLGITLLHGKGKYTILIKEFYITTWTSGHKVTRYRKTPKKYQILIDNQ